MGSEMCIRDRIWDDHSGSDCEMVQLCSVQFKVDCALHLISGKKMALTSFWCNHHSCVLTCHTVTPRDNDYTLNLRLLCHTQPFHSLPNTKTGTIPKSNDHDRSPVCSAEMTTSSIWTRKRDLVYLGFFAIHLPVMFRMYLIFLRVLSLSKA